ncbi:hypothetical protein [Mesorhizobium sp.]|uniref:hypothetical protein n=1 Tax=Mesorhizobium sp. TaxID=1871066 RepID=UPI000FE856D4|nr:hypothetical protein [Mesorhizobium sp.]RWC59498.1 MAG: hypothetical protein EOS29_21980 [Mesorhizobium sp.]RWC60479.1 MAG: hypothetical protein EOS56_14420 [Mesorhizobium sp.]
MTVKRPLNSDELGEHGEAQFRPICTGLGLLVNKSERDRTGWDYRVELPNKFLDTATYADKRPPLPAYVFQVKAMWADNRSFSAPLLSMERLAKTPEPSFVFVIRFRPDLSIKDAFVIHLAAAPLDQVLKRLTAESSVGRPITNKKRISFKLGFDWQKTPLEPAAFLRHIQGLCESYAGGGNYSEIKRKQRETAGYANNPVKINLTIQTKSHDDLVDGFLGLSPLRITSLSSTEERFGFRRPYGLNFSGAGTLSVEPTGRPDCRLLFRRGRNGKPIVRSGTLILSPIQPASRFLFQSFPISLDIRPAAEIGLDGTVDLNIADTSDEAKPIGWWKELCEIFDMLASGECRVDLHLPTGEKIFGADVPTGRSLKQGYAEWLEDFSRALEHLDKLVGRVGMSDTGFSVADVELASKWAYRCVALVEDVGTTFEAKVDNLLEAAEEVIGEPKAGAMAQVARIGKVDLLFCVVANMTLVRKQNGETVLKSITTERGFLEIGSFGNLDSFAHTCAKEIGAQYLIIGGWDFGAGGVGELTDQGIP